MDKLLSSCSIPDVYGGWKPIAMSNYLDFNETPVVLSALAKAGNECVGKSGKTSTLAVFFVVDVIVMFLSHLSSVNIFTADGLHCWDLAFCRCALPVD